MRASGPVRARFNPFDAEFRRNPYPAYQALRNAGAGHRALGLLILTRHADVAAALRDPALSSSLVIEQARHRAQALGIPPVDCLVRFGQQSMVFTDPPEHHRLRRLIRQAFTPRRLADLNDHIARVVTDIVAAVLGVSQDVDGALIARMVPLAVMASKLAIPREMWTQVAEWTDKLRLLLDPALLGAESLHSCNNVIATYTGYLGTLVAERRRNPGEDLMSEFLSLRDGADCLTEEEVVHACLIVLMGGHETTTALITNLLAAILDHPDQQALVRAEPSLIRQAVREALRWDAPLQQTKRLALRDTQAGETPVRQGDCVLLCLGAANRDPLVFDDPDVFEIRRREMGNLGFGAGMHTCLGAQLAEMEAMAVLSALLCRSNQLLPGVGERHRGHSELIIRGYTSLPITLYAAKS